MTLYASSLRNRQYRLGIMVLYLTSKVYRVYVKVLQKWSLLPSKTTYTLTTSLIKFKILQKINNHVQFFCRSLESSLQTPLGGESRPFTFTLEVFLERLNFATSSPNTSPVLRAEMRSSNSPFWPLVRVPSRELSEPVSVVPLDFPRDFPTEESRLDCLRSIVRLFSWGVVKV